MGVGNTCTSDDLFGNCGDAGAGASDDDSDGGGGLVRECGDGG